MKNTIENNNRYNESLAPYICHEMNEGIKSVFLLSPTDNGVIRNNGRNGARYAPEAIINVLKKMNNHLDASLNIFMEVVSDHLMELNDFEKAQQSSSQIIQKLIEYSLCTDRLCKHIVHLGGGHDHAYPLLKAIEQNDQIKNILIFNVDAHCDTRIDKFHHSGTPFRNFTDETKKNIHVIQYGIHNYANSESTLTPLKNATERHYSLFKVREESKGYRKIDRTLFERLPFEFGDDTFIFLSLDCDAIESSIMEGVSAVNHEGIPLAHIQLIIDKIKTFSGPKAFGIYEYNPIYDNLSQKGARAICALIYNWLSK